MQQQLAQRDAQLEALQRRSSRLGPPSPAASLQWDSTPEPLSHVSPQYRHTAECWPSEPAPAHPPQLRHTDPASCLPQHSARRMTMLQGSSTNPLFVAAHTPEGSTAPATSQAPTLPPGRNEGTAEQAELIAELQRQVAELRTLRQIVVQPGSLAESALASFAAHAESTLTPTAEQPVDRRPADLQSVEERRRTTEPPTRQPLATPVPASAAGAASSVDPTQATVLSSETRAAAPGAGRTADYGAQAPAQLLLFDAATNTGPPTVDAGSNTASFSGCQTEAGQEERIPHAAAGEPIDGSSRIFQVGFTSTHRPIQLQFGF